MLQRYTDAEIGRKGESPDHFRNADALHRQRRFIRHIANLLAMLAGLAGQAPASVCASIGTRRGCPWTKGSPVNSHQSSGSRTSARNDQPSADTEATATSGLVGVAAGCVSREQRGAAGAAQQEQLIRRDTPQPAAAWRCELQWDVGTISQRYVAAWCANSAVSEGIGQRGLRTGLRTAPRRTSL